MNYQKKVEAIWTKWLIEKIWSIYLVFLLEQNYLILIAAKNKSNILVALLGLIRVNLMECQKTLLKI